MLIGSGCPAFQASRREKRKTKQKKEAGPEERGREPTLALHAVVSWEADAPIFSTAGAGHKRKWKQEERGNQREVFPKGTASPRLQGGHRYISLNWEHPMAEERVFRRKKGVEFHPCIGELANALANAFTVGKRIGELANAFANPLANSRTRWRTHSLLVNALGNLQMRSRMRSRIRWQTCECVGERVGKRIYCWQTHWQICKCVCQSVGKLANAFANAFANSLANLHLITEQTRL